MLHPMIYARSILIPKGSAGTFHCVSRCVRRAFLCGEDRLTGRSFEHRRQLLEDRIHELAAIFGVAVWGYAVMSNHLHVVVQTLPEAVARWSDDEVAQKKQRKAQRKGHARIRKFLQAFGHFSDCRRPPWRPMLHPMTYARSILIPKGSAGTFHCVSRCVRPAFLCGEDRLTGRSFE